MSRPSRYTVLMLFLALSLACSLPGIGAPRQPAPTATPPPPPTATPRADLPPALIETDPPLGSEISPRQGITWYFNQPMQRASVEAALRSNAGISGRFEWQDDSTVTFYPQTPFTPESDLLLTLDTGAQAKNGKAMPRAVSVRYRVAGPLRLTQRLPAPGSRDVDPSAAVVAAFNRPVTPLGADPAGLPAAFTLNPPARGRGEWLNTSTYVFYPEPALLGGTLYTVTPNPALLSAAGTPLETADPWQFRTAAPRVVKSAPSPDAPLPPDATLTVQFNQPMNPASVEAALSLDGGAAFDLEWDETFTALTLRPAALLQRGARYTLRIAVGAQSAGGSPLEEAFEASWTTYPRLQVLEAPQPVLDVYDSARIRLSAPPPSDADLSAFVQVEPLPDGLQVWWADWGDGGIQLLLRGEFTPLTEYAVTLLPDFPDAWGGALGEPVRMSFRTAALPPRLTVLPFSAGNVVVVTPRDGGLPVTASNLQSVNVESAPLPLSDFLRLATASDYDALSRFTPADLKREVIPLDAPPDRLVTRTLAALPARPGVYYVNIAPPDAASAGGALAAPAPLGSFPTSPYLVVVTNVNLTFKRGQRDALVWAAYMDGGAAAGAPVALYDASGQLVARGATDSDGLFYADGLPEMTNWYDASVAVLGEPGDAYFSVALSSMNQGLGGMYNPVAADYRPPHLYAYLYTDRPIYRPGQTVSFRLVERRAFDGRYDLPPQEQTEVVVYDGEGGEVQRMTLPLTEYGTASGQYTLPADAPPGQYRISVPEADAALFFQVVEYRKPEFEVQVQPERGEMQAGSVFRAQVSAQYYFGAPAGGLTVHWELTRRPDAFSLPGFAVGPLDVPWFNPYPPGLFDEYGAPVASGDAVTDADGRFSVETPLPETDASARYVLEVTAADESGFPVSARAEVRVHPEAFYIGARAEQWVAPAGSERTFEVRTVDWGRNPSGGRALSVQFAQVTWERRPAAEPGAPARYEKALTPLANVEVRTDDNGAARLAFTPPSSGLYQVTLRGGNALTELLFWVGGAQGGVWPALPNQNLLLAPDRDSYRPGDTAQVFVPNPFGVELPVLVTLERGVIHRYEVQRLPAGGGSISVPLDEQAAPNLYLTVTLLGQRADGSPDFRYGVRNLPVEPERLTLQVNLLDLPAETVPQAEVTVRLRVTDADGNPVQGAFSLAVVDKAALALADPNSAPIEQGFYGVQGLGIRTGIGLTAYARRVVDAPGGMGGGGGAVTPAVRREFPDTAFWQPEIVTDAGGEAVVTFTVPDSLTTWVLDLRGVTRDSRVGQAQAELVVAKPLLVRPVTPRFVVMGDHFPLAAVVHNNTGQRLDVQVQLQAPGFLLDDPAAALQSVSLEAGGRARVDWWGVVGDAESLEAQFSAQGGRWSDAALPQWGALPVLRFSAPQTFASAGVLSAPGDVLEVVSLPRTFPPEGGELQVEVAPSPAAAMLESLDALEHYPYECTEQTLSRFLPNLMAYRALQEFGLQSPDLEARLQRTLDDGVQRLLRAQREDGGWAWWPSASGGDSDVYVTAYVLFGLKQAQQAGVSIPQERIRRAADYLLAALTLPSEETADWALDRQAMVAFALGSQALAERLYPLRSRLSPASQALLALAFPAGSAQSDVLLSDLQGAAARSATGAHWQADSRYRVNMGSDVQSTAAVVYALSERQPASPLLPDAVRYLMAARTGRMWASTYETAWSVLALTRYMQGTGDLAGDFEFSAQFNGAPLLAGDAAGEAQLTPVRASVPLAQLYADSPNALVIHRGEGQGRLYYRVRLNVLRPAAGLPPLSQGMSLQRRYFRPAEGARGAPLHSAQAGDLLEVRLTLTLPEDVHYLVVEDYFPAGAEVLDARLKTSRTPPAGAEYRAFEDGWGWWLFHAPQIFDDRIAWSADYLPAGTYELRYFLALSQPGEYRVLPARAYAFYFPEVQGRSAGETFVIEEKP